MKFFKRLFCVHVWNQPIQTSKCEVIEKCIHCSKKKKFYYHEYKEIKRYEKTTIESKFIVKVFECKKCGDIYSKEYTI
jgi:hypothetical protein